MAEPPQVEGTLYLGFSLEPKIVVLDDNVAKVSMTAETGVEIKGKLAPTKNTDTVKHECEACIDGDIKGKITLNAGISLFSLSKLLGKQEKSSSSEKDKDKKTWDFKLDIVDFTMDIGKFYYSFDFKEFGFTSCPHYGYKVTVRAVDSNFNSVSGAKISIDGEEKGVTNENGTLDVILPNGVYNAWARKDDNEGYDEIYVQNDPKYEVIKIKAKKSYDYDGSLDISQFIEPSKPVETEPMKPDIDTDDNFINVEKVPILNIDDFVGRTFVSKEGDKITFLRDETQSSSSGEVYISFYWSLKGKTLIQYLGNDFMSSTYNEFEDMFHDGYMSMYCDYTAYDRSIFYSAEIIGRHLVANKWNFFMKYIGGPEFLNKTFTETSEKPIVINSKIKYKISDNNEIEIVDCGSDEIKKVAIPKTINGLPVTLISNHAFEYCTSLENINIPNSVRAIEKSAFSHCEKLESIIVPDNVTSIESYTFFYCKNLKNITIPYSVNSIESGAFEYCTSLESILIPNSVISIGNYAFAECTSLKSIIIPDSVKSIGYNTFYNCTNLENIFIPDSVTSIDIQAFEGCSNLKDIYYSGSKEQWNKIEDIDSIDAVIHFNSTMPSSITEYSSNMISENINTYKEYDQSKYFSKFLAKENIIQCNYSGNDFKPNETYNLYVVKSDAEYLTSENLIYITQVISDESGYISTSYNIVGSLENSVFLTAMSETDISTANVTVPDILCNGKEQFAEPIIKLNNKILEIGRDYSIEGDYSGIIPREYDINIVGKGEYKGYLNTTYNIYCEHSFSGDRCSICNSLNSIKGDVNGDKATGVADLVALERFLVKRKLTVDGNPDINGDGNINAFDAVSLRRIILKS